MCSEDENFSESAGDNSEDDLITLGELTEYESTVWRFPDIRRCPVRSCGMHFETRAKTIEHYRKTHAKHAVLCRICDYPLMLLTAAHHLVGHYARKHPKDTPPVKVKTTRHECLECHSTFKNYVYLNNHMNKIHRRQSKKGKSSAWRKPKKGQAKRRKVTKVDNNLFTSKSSVKSDKTTESWEDIESDISTSVDATSDTANDSQDVSDPSTQATTNSIRQLVKRKARSFNPQNKLRSCTICGRFLKNYLLANNHYRKAHGRTVSMCSFCGKYFDKSTALIQHMKKFHQFRYEIAAKLNNFRGFKPLVKPTKLRKSDANKKGQNDVKQKRGTMSKDAPKHKRTLEKGAFSPKTYESNLTKQIDGPMEVPFENGEANDDDISQDEVITLGEMTEYPTMRWHFPDTTACPRTNCKQKFNTRNEAFKHYRDQHSIWDVQCKECNILVSLSGAHNLINHYKRSHPNVDLPAKAFENKTTCHVCQKVLSFQQMRVHLFTRHNQDAPSIPSKMVKSDRILKRKSLNLKRMDSETKQAKSSARSLLRSKSVCHPGYSASFTTAKKNAQDDENDEVPVSKGVPIERTRANVLDASHVQSTHDPPQTEQTSHINPQSSSNDQRKSQRCVSTSELSPKQKTRSTGVRSKGCTICGMVLSTYVIACEHYHRLHGRNVMMCPYCGQYFVQGHLLTKHVMAVHSEDSAYAAKKADDHITTKEGGKGAVEESQNDIDVPDAQTHNAETHDTHSHDTEAPVFDAIPPMQPVELGTAAEKQECAQDMQPNDEPLNLTVQKDSDFGVIDLASGALDLSRKK
ncbi:uncharacterized protein LOC129565582 isoform X2 [Sitodiplosis mosellana]|uniref:uncharacterized protein LOC129565582 isoform X2 n=1 Tax=Sitodiplosis mosellana TaxID=263140 RepID=UPI002444EB54|nr:uncharacterized protein LOC129565582 isoform X2 [Sitodiplosis mosellana]